MIRIVEEHGGRQERAALAKPLFDQVQDEAEGSGCTAAGPDPAFHDIRKGVCLQVWIGFGEFRYQ